MLKNSLIVILAAVSTAAFGQEATPDNWMSETSSVSSRAEVRAEAIRQRASGELARMEDPGYLPTMAHSRTRGEVLADLHGARHSGELGQIGAEAYDFAAAVGDKRYFAFRQVIARRQ